jgi:ribonucleoside-diphosphate reductase alpha chain
MNESYRSSALLAKEKGSFPYFRKDPYLDGKFIAKLDASVRDLIAEHGIRNSHLTSIAPTGTISFTADNISGGIEPVYALEQLRYMNMPEGQVQVRVKDYGYREFGVKGRVTAELSAKEHIDVFTAAQKFVDSAVSKTCNIGDDVTFEEFKNVYLSAYEKGAKGCTTFRAAGKRFGILHAVTPEAEDEPTGQACTIDPSTGERSCAD